MTKLYVITGFLGAGKTTFLKELAREFQDEKLAVLVNEFGKESVDSKLLSDLGAAMEEVHSGSIFCACRVEQFSDALSRLLDDSPDTILVETSGLSDPTRVNTLFSEHPKADLIDYQGCLCIADAVRFEKVYATAMVCGKQLDVCNVVIVNKTDMASDGQKQRTMDIIKNRRPDVPVYMTSYGKIQPEWLRSLDKMPTATKGVSYHVKDISLQSRIIVINNTITKDKLQKFLMSVAPASYRIKGFVQLQEGVFFVDAVGDDVKITPWNKKAETLNKLVVLAGKGLPMLSALKEASRDFDEYILSVE
ncbi:MAG: GTP-binding protein [Oscillospiraceae bacterium]|nr:GTP-binding protein [Oscillospiraceae bacterium]MDD4414308.1 GTP-binding protein [Oscillospiraceae bacterium]